MTLWIVNEPSCVAGKFKAYASINAASEGTAVKDWELCQPDHSVATTQIVREIETGKIGILVYVNADYERDEIVDTCAHEATHVSDIVFDWIGAYSQGFDETNEPYAYLLGFCAGKIYDHYAKVIAYGKEK